MPPAMEAQSSNHWTAKEVPPLVFLSTSEFGHTLHVQAVNLIPTSHFFLPDFYFSFIQDLV